MAKQVIFYLTSNHYVIKINIVFIKRFLRFTGMIVFLNKQDLLEQKIKSGAKISNYFPEYKTYKLSNEDIIPNMDLEFLRARCFIRQALMVKLNLIQIKSCL